MKLCVILNQNEEVLGREYEPYYEYSEWTSGGDYWFTTYKPLSEIVDAGDDNYFRMAIFESKEKAKNYLKSNLFNQDEKNYTIKSLGEL